MSVGDRISTILKPSQGWGRGILRILVVLLIARFLASPIAARPFSRVLRTNGGFIARVCAWPAQRPVRPASTALLANRRGGPRNHFHPSTRPRVRPVDRPPAPLALALAPPRKTSSVYLTDCPRF